MASIKGVRARLTVQSIGAPARRRIVAAYRAGAPAPALARRFGVSETFVYRVLALEGEPIRSPGASAAVAPASPLARRGSEFATDPLEILDVPDLLNRPGGPLDV
jgi:hypothetical protein